MAMADLAGVKAFYKWRSYRKYSSQQLIDCTYKRYKYYHRRFPNLKMNNACQGGLLHYNSLYAASNGLLLDRDYPFKGENQYCQTNKVG